jgi:hypothetical protein
MEAQEQCRLAAVAGELAPDWHCPALDRWLRLEFYAKRHNILDMEQYIPNSGAGLNEDPFQFGRLRCLFPWIFFFTCILGQRLVQIRDIRPQVASRRGVRVRSCNDETRGPLWIGSQGPALDRE